MKIKGDYHAWRDFCQMTDDALTNAFAKEPEEVAAFKEAGEEGTDYLSCKIAVAYVTEYHFSSHITAPNIVLNDLERHKLKREYITVDDSTVIHYALTKIAKIIVSNRLKNVVPVYN